MTRRDIVVVAVLAGLGAFCGAFFFGSNTRAGRIAERVMERILIPFPYN